MPDLSIKQTIDELIARESLPDSYRETVQVTLMPLVDAILSRLEQEKRTLLVAIHGAQGTGKSTLTLFLREILGKHRDCPTASFSLDDIYLTRAERRKLAQEVHPLFMTRGVPGTHDVELGQRVIRQLMQAGPDDETPVPAFDKSVDDRLPEEQWPVFRGRPRVILVEGWCMGARPQDESRLAVPVNRLEAEEDPKGIWRHYVNHCLEGSYHRFFGSFDSLIMLRAPSMESVLQWRTLQEHKLAERTGIAPKQGDGAGGAPRLRIMTDEEVARFIMHYERVTRACLEEMPARADVVIDVAEDHTLGLPVFRNH